MNGLVVIPFRKGSKGLKNKAFAVVGGMTLVERTLRQAVDWLPWPVVLYTDYTPDEIEDNGCSLQGTVQVMTDTEDQDNRTLDGVLRDITAVLAVQQAAVDAVALMTPNTPVRKAEWLQRAAEGFLGVYPGAASTFIVEPTVKQLWALGRESQWGSANAWTKLTSGHHGPRQTMAPEAYIEHTGTFLLSRTGVLANGRRIGAPALPVPVRHPWVGLDIHTQADVDLANYLYDKGEWS